MCFYGLYHGLVFLPVVLSLIGPSPYPRPAADSASSAGTNDLLMQETDNKYSVRTLNSILYSL